jgi:biotin carboxyl carrier protein
MATQQWFFDDAAITSSTGAAIVWENDTFFTLEYKGRVFNGEIVEEKTEDRLIRVKLNHREFVVKKGGPLDELISAMGLDVPKVKLLKELAAPMPGRIVNIAVQVGQQVEVGDPILSLEAMKMENVLKAEGIGTVKTIFVGVSNVVDKGMVLIDFE